MLLSSNIYYGEGWARISVTTLLRVPSVHNIHTIYAGSFTYTTVTLTNGDDVGNIGVSYQQLKGRGEEATSIRDVYLYIAIDENVYRHIYTHL